MLLNSFITTFQRAIAVEIDATRERAGASDIGLANGRPAEESGHPNSYRFDLLTLTDRLAPSVECTFVGDAGTEYPVTIVAADARMVLLRCDRVIVLGGGSGSLLLDPSFLYEKLNDALGSLLGAPERYNTASALMLFGKDAPTIAPRPLLADHAGLNESQMRAVRLCAESNLAFIWGPPGTGKTLTLGHIVTELLAGEGRILITSMTNAAIDQALDKLAALEGSAGYFERGEVIRIGEGTGEMHGAGLNDVVAMTNVALRGRIDRLRGRSLELAEAIERCGRLLEKLAQSLRPMQFDMFRETSAEKASERELAPIFGESLAAVVAGLPAERLRSVVELRLARLERAAGLCREKTTASVRELRNQESTAIGRARVIVATMTNVYLSPLLRDERFDAVIVEEAGMALLPALFYCASLARRKVIMVGDPKQLPPIVQAGDPMAQRAMGRSIFEVTVPQPHGSPIVAMLDVQYRMHPAIGDLVSRLFYDGRLINGEHTHEREEIAARPPYAGEPLVVVDTRGRTACRTRSGSYSRFNEGSAKLCVDLAVEAIRAGMESVAIITPYAEQSRFIRGLLGGFRLESRMIECRTVHRFQGSERDLVILDTVDTAPMSPGVLLAGSGTRSSSRNLMNVSISRARGKLVMVSDVGYFRRTAPGSAVDDLLGLMLLEGTRVEME